jgi:hypothetical protein
MPARALQIRAGISPTCTAVEKASHTIKQKKREHNSGTHNAELPVGQPLERDRHQRERCDGHKYSKAQQDQLRVFLDPGVKQPPSEFEPGDGAHDEDAQNANALSEHKRVEEDQL